MKRVSTFVAILAVVIVYTFAALPAYACACGGVQTAEDNANFVAWYNARPDAWRMSVADTVHPPPGYVLAEDASMVPLSFFDY